MRHHSARLGSSVFALLLVSGSAALGRSEAETAYSREQTFSAALRYLRVDLAYEVTEKDPEAAYLLFSFPTPELEQKSAHGSIEVVQTERNVRVMVSLPQLPSYQEDVLKRGLLQKLRSEYGDPPKRAKQPPPKADPPAPAEPVTGDKERKPEPAPT